MPVSLRLCRFFLPLVALCALLAPSALAADAPRPGAVGDSGHLWLAAPAPSASDGWQVLHRQPGQTGTVAPVPGTVAVPVALPDGSPALCARGGTLFVASAKADGSLQFEELQISQPAHPEQGLSLTRRPLAGLPPGVKLLAMTADRQKLWLAVEAAPAEVPDAMEPAKTQGAPALAPAVENPLDLVLGLPPGTVATKVDSALDPVSGLESKPAPATQYSKEKQLLLLRETNGRFVLEKHFPLARPVHLASDGQRMFFAYGAQAVQGAEDFATGGSAASIQALFVGSQSVLAQITLEHIKGETAWSHTLKAKWGVRRQKFGPAGECALPLGEGEGYGVVEWEGHAALARVSAGFKPGHLAATLVPVDLKGGVLPTVELLQAGDPKVGRDQVLWLLAGSVLVAFLLMGWTWRRGPRLLPHLPPHLKRAGLLRRAGALMIDLSLVAVPVAKIAGVPVVAIIRNWPNLGDPSDLADMRLGIITVSVFILHTLLGEWLFGRSAGKVMMGIGVVGLDGKRAPFWRILLRGVLKWIELLNPMLAIIAVFSPFGQRLGDLTAGTVVVSIRKPGEFNDPQ